VLEHVGVDKDKYTKGVYYGTFCRSSNGKTRNKETR